MEASLKLRRHGYHLMSLASIGQFVCFALLLWNLSMRTWDPQRAAQIHDPATWRTLAVAACVIWLAQAWTLVQLRRIGRRLHSGETVSHAMAAAWRRLGNALAVVGVLSMFPLRPAPAATGGLDLALGFDMGGLYFVAIACLCIFSIAHILQEAATLKDDNESIV